MPISPMRSGSTIDARLSFLRYFNSRINCLAFLMA